MRSITTPPSAVPAPSPEPALRSIPSLDELRAWTSEPDHRVVLKGVDWTFYEQLVDSIPEGANIHVDISRWVLEEVRRTGSKWAQRLRAWVRAELAPRLAR